MFHDWGTLRKLTSSDARMLAFCNGFWKKKNILNLCSVHQSLFKRPVCGVCGECLNQLQSHLGLPWYHIQLLQIATLRMCKRYIR